MGVLAHERFGKLRCGECPSAVRDQMGCPFAVGPQEAKRFGGEHVPGDPATWPNWVVGFGGATWDSRGCPWPQFVEEPELDRWMAAYHALSRWGKTPVDLGVWPKLRADYLDVMFLLDRLFGEAEREAMEQMQQRADAQLQARLHRG